jgi:phosphoribosylformimino-5-aminoimidazole carboxamide ribotide isomerase
MDQPVVYDVDPVDIAKSFQEQGAEWLHVLDLDAAGQRENDNSELICKIIEQVFIPVEVAGGIRGMAAVDWWVEQGAARVVISTAAVKDPQFVKEACGRYPGQIVISVDARGDRVVVEGWTETTAFSPLEFARQFQTDDIAGIIFTDIDRDDDLPESSLAATTDLASKLVVPVIASGTVKSLDDISTLRYLPNISGAITGRALFSGTFSLADAIAVAREQ